ncbi:MAG: hypothetical protein LBH98_09200 [Chitinispirillales bacterium]|jgi:hypothetical protein|nr:hypothetical protein [Chitinispirillales bacterium]
MSKENKRINPFRSVFEGVKRKDKSKRLKIILVLLFCTLVDISCFGFMIYAMGLSLLYVLIGGVLSGLLTNLASYVCGDFGYGQIKEVKQTIVNTKNERILEQIKSDREIAWFIFVVTFIAIIVLQSVLSFKKYQQIVQHNVEFNEKYVEWKKIKESDEFQTWKITRQDSHIENEPKDANGVIDLATFMFPLLTTIFSFVFGVKFRNEYYGIKDLYDKKCKEITDWYNKQDEEEKPINDDSKEKVKKLENEKKEKIEELKNTSNKLLKDAEKIIGPIDDLGKLKGKLYDAIMESIEEKPNNKPLYECREKLIEEIIQILPKYYEYDIEDLHKSLIVVAGKIKNDLCSLATNTQLHSLNEDEKYQSRLQNLKCAQNIFKPYKGSEK